MFELTDPEVDVFVLGHPRWRPIDVGDRQTHDLGRKRSETALEEAVLACEAQRQQRPPVIAALEANHHRTPGELARQLDSVLNALRAAVGEDGLLGKLPRRQLV